MQINFGLTVRGAVSLTAALLFAGVALAAPVKDHAKLAGCIDKATLEFTIADSQCTTRPPGAINQCRAEAAQAYSLAIHRCAAEDAKSAARFSTSSLSGLGDASSTDRGDAAPTPAPKVEPFLY